MKFQELVLKLYKIPSTAVSTFLRDAVIHNVPYLEKKGFILIDREKISLDQCDQNLKYLFNILDDETIPFQKRKEIAHSSFKII